jgi:aspartyl/asparaginyl beta-hydroxylase (cupin superfamily)
MTQNASSPPPPLWFSFESPRFDGPEPAFFPKEDFPFLAELEAGWRMILGEVQSLIAEESGRLKPYLHKRMSFPPGDWKTLAFYFWKLRVRENCEKCPGLDALLSRIPGLTAASVSVLEPGTKIHPHYGDTNAIARIHLGLVIPGDPPDCAFQVCDEIRAWHPGRAHAFCDAHFHMAWNYTDKRRIILILDVMRPAYLPQTNAICGRVLAALSLLSAQESFPALKRVPRSLLLPVWKMAGSLVGAFLPRRSPSPA